MEKLEATEEFTDRHIGPSAEDIEEMLKTIGVDSIEEIITKTIPSDIRLKEELNLPEGISENDFLGEIESLAEQNKIFKSYIGMGYYPTFTPSVIVRNVLENPGWYTSYTPYQAEISQGRMEAMLNFQTMVADLTALPLANASLLDEGTAAAEAMRMFYSARKGKKKTANTFLVDKELFPQTIALLENRAEPIGINLKILSWKEFELTDDVFGLLVQYPDNSGSVNDYSELFEMAKNENIFVGVATDLLSLALLTPPGELGADAAFGNSQRFGVPMGYGGPHAAFFATKNEFKRLLPGRVIGVTVDKFGKPALRMALQMREQHIKRERATSNICTAQALLADIAGFYAVYHGPEGIKKIAERVHKLSVILNNALKLMNYEQSNEFFFDTLRVSCQSSVCTDKIKRFALENGINFRYFENNDIGISLNETTVLSDVKDIIRIFSVSSIEKIEESFVFEKMLENSEWQIPEKLKRKSAFLTHPVFNSYHSEIEMMRYIKKLENKDISLVHSMIPLGSCTMKLSAATEMFPITWKSFSDIHPFVPKDQALGYEKLISELENYLKEITGFASVSFMPNSGAQGEYTGLSVINAFHISRGEANRNVVLIPSSAHGTNPASSVMAGNVPVIVACDENGNIDVEDLKRKAEENSENLSALMVTYPSTHGVFEEKIKEICEIVHANGGQVYMDGANMNAQVGLTRPREIGADVCHLNLHKTFGIPHGGGGPGVGPIAVAEHLVEFLPSHPVVPVGGKNGIKPTASAPYGSAGILPISFGYVKMLGKSGLKKSTEIAILNANYIKAKLAPYFKVLYTNENGFVAHELIFDLNEFKHSVNIDSEDVAKRLMDYGFHAPTVSFPVHGTLMVEPTESESKEELDRFCEAMISIRKEIEEVENGTADREDNVIKNAPHTALEATSDEWNHSYSRTKAAYPLEWLKEKKFWPPVARVDNAYGDRNLFTVCPPVENK